MDINTLVLETLQKAISQDANILKEAEQKLQEWETQPGFYSFLKEVFTNRSIDVSLRLIAILLCKNGVDKYWRPNAPNAIAEEEKASIRESIISDFQEPEKQIAIHMSVLIARIARHDWPNNWTQLMPTLMDAVKCDDPLSQHSSLLTLHQVVKILSAKRLSTDRCLFMEFTPVIFPVMSELWDNNSQLFFMMIIEGRNEGESFKALERSYLMLKILEKFTIHGFRRPHESNFVITFIKTLFQKARTMLEIRPNLKYDSLNLSSKFITKCMNTLLLLLQHHPFSFVQFITPSLEFIVYYAFTPQGEPFLFERFLIQCFNLLKSILNCFEFKTFKDKKTQPEALKANQLKQAFFDQATLELVCKRLITHYFLLTPVELEMWDSDPEAFASDEGGEAWKYSLRPSMETLFASLFHLFVEPLTPFILGLVREAQPLVPPFDISAILFKDAVYNAVGKAAFDLYDVINIDEWYTATLHTEMSIMDNNYRIIRRRAAWLIGIWTGVRMSSDLHTNIYADMIKLLRPEEDMVVRLIAANTVRTVVDDFEFNLESFLEFLEPMFVSLFNLLKEAQEYDTKMKVLHVLYFIVERVGLAIEPYYNTFVQYLPILWQETANHSMLRCAVVTTLVHLVRAIGKLNKSEEVAAFILSVISLSTDVRQDCHVYLLEDGLELWQCVLEHSSFAYPALLQLFNNMPPLLEGNMEHLRLCVNVIEAYVLLFPEDILQIYGDTLISLFADMLSDMRSEGILVIMRLMELFLRVNPSRSCSILKPLLPHVFEVICNGDEFSLSHNQFAMLMSVYLSILSRVLLSSQEAVIEAINQVSEKMKMSPDDVLRKIINEWLHHMPIVNLLEKKKLLGLALSSLLVSNFKFVFEKFHGIVQAVTEVLNDIMTPENGNVCEEVLISIGEGDDNSDDNCYETDHQHRKQQLAMRDPVYTIVLRDYFRSQLLALQRDIGHNEFEKFLATVDSSTLSSLREYVAL